jgi:hypothetical protein
LLFILKAQAFLQNPATLQQDLTAKSVQQPQIQKGSGTAYAAKSSSKHNYIRFLEESAML